MRAAFYERTGAARDVLHLGERLMPRAGAGEVLVRVHASGINPSDVKRRAGARGGSMEYPLMIPHSDGAGLIEAVGNGVPAARIGERVWLTNAHRGRPFGTAAEYIAIAAHQAVPLPDGISFAEGACLGIPALTAYRCVTAPGDVRGKTLLVTGGAGAVCSAAVQLARWLGATVIATVSSEEKAAHARAAGAAYTINYRNEDVAARCRELTHGRGIDHVVDVAFGANLATNIAALAPNGSIATYGSDAVGQPVAPVSALMAKCITIYFVLVYVLTHELRQEMIAAVNAALQQGALKPVVALRRPLDAIVAAHEAVERGDVIGNVVLEL
jgi:NADPH:quinone reductase